MQAHRYNNSNTANNIKSAFVSLSWMRILLFSLLVSSCARDVAFAQAAQAAAAPVTVVVETELVPAQNPWNVRPGIDSVVLIPAAQARQLSQSLLERNTCVDVVKTYGTMTRNYETLHSIDSTRIENYKHQQTLSDSLSAIKLSAADSKNWNWFFGGVGIGTLVTSGVGVVILILTHAGK